MKPRENKNCDFKIDSAPMCWAGSLVCVNVNVVKMSSCANWTMMSLNLHVELWGSSALLDLIHICNVLAQMLSWRCPLFFFFSFASFEPRLSLIFKLPHTYFPIFLSASFALASAYWDDSFFPCVWKKSISLKLERINLKMHYIAAIRVNKSKF